MLMNLGQSIFKKVLLIKYRMIMWQLHKFIVWKYLFDFITNILVHSVIIINMQKSATSQVVS